jgi:MFS family permease
MAGSLLRKRDVRLVVSAVGVSSAGDFLLWVPLTLHLRAMNGSGLVVAGLFLALWTPVVVLAPAAGLLVDRLEARGVLIVASLAQAAISASLALVLGSTAAILALAVLLGVGFAIAQPAEFALIPAVAGDDGRLSVLNGYIETARYVGMTAGPVVGGVLAGLGGTRIAMLVNAGTFVFVALAAMTLRARRRVERIEGEHERARDGVVVLFRDRTLALVLSVAFISLLFMSASISAEVFFVKDNLGASDFAFGLVFAAWTTGMVVGAVAVARRVRDRARGTLVAIGVQGAGLGLPTAVLSLPFGAVSWFFGGLGHGTKNVLARTLIQERVPARLHGRAYAAYNGLRNGAELVALAVGGLLVVTIGARTTLALAGAIPLVAALAGLAVQRRLEGRREAELPAPLTAPE